MLLISFDYLLNIKSDGLRVFVLMQREGTASLPGFTHLVTDELHYVLKQQVMIYIDYLIVEDKGGIVEVLMRVWQVLNLEQNVSAELPNDRTLILDLLQVALCYLKAIMFLHNELEFLKLWF